MTIKVPRGDHDSVIDQIINALKPFEAKHHSAEIALYRQNPVSIRVRIIDGVFDSKNKTQRHQLVWRYLEKLPEDIQSDISMILLLTPEEKTRSFANFEFEDPVPSQL